MSTLGSVLGTLSDLAAVALAGPAPIVRGGVAGDVVRILGAAAGVAGKLATDGVDAATIVEKIRRVLPLDERVRAQDAAIAAEIDRRFPARSAPYFLVEVQSPGGPRWLMPMPAGTRVRLTANVQDAQRFADRGAADRFLRGAMSQLPDRTAADVTEHEDVPPPSREDEPTAEIATPTRIGP